MGFESTLKQTASEIEAVMSDLLAFNGADARTVIDAMRYSALGQGKRLRPFFVTESAGLFGVDRSHALRAGAALECIHCYSLVHDDLPAMDDDDLRRGKPTTHIAFSEATAILAGDGLLTHAFQIMSAPDTHPDPQVRCDLVAMLAHASGAEGMVGGQMLDLEAEAREATTLEETITLQSLKTGALFGSPARRARFSARRARMIARRFAPTPTVSASPSRSPTTCSTPNRPLRNWASAPRRTPMPARRPLSICSASTVPAPGPMKSPTKPAPRSRPMAMPRKT